MKSFSPEMLKQDLDFSQPMRVLVAYSGGLDSHVLLHSLVSLQKLYSSLQVRAVHVNHGLNSNAQAWELHCQAVCQTFQVVCKILTVDVKAHLVGNSLEAAARNQRYKALAAELQTGEYLMVGHNEDDQAETVLLQLLRGSGVKGLAAMPYNKKFAAGYLVRPLLHISRSALKHYAREEGLVWIEDGSNAEIRIARNYLRHQIIPQCELYWPSTKKVLSRVAQHCAQANALIEELAAQDLLVVAGQVTGTLSVSGLLKLSTLRRSNVLRFWLARLQLPLPNTKRLQQLEQDFLFSKPDAAPEMAWPGVEVRRYGDDLYAMPPLPFHDPSLVLVWDILQPLSLPSLGLVITQQALAGLSIPSDVVVSVRFRRGGERFHPKVRKGSHPLKKLFQEWRVPPWRRERVPLLYFNEELVVVVNYAIAHQYAVVD